MGVAKTDLTTAVKHLSVITFSNAISVYNLTGQKKSNVWKRATPEWWPDTVVFRDPNNEKPRMTVAE